MVLVAGVVGVVGVDAPPACFECVHDVANARVVYVERGFEQGVAARTIVYMILTTKEWSVQIKEEKGVSYFS